MAVALRMSFDGVAIDVSVIVVAVANAPAGIFSVAPDARATSPPSGPIATDVGVLPLELDEELDVPPPEELLEAPLDVPEVPDAQKPPSGTHVFVDAQHV
jgi:hypothetical protein